MLCYRRGGRIEWQRGTSVALERERGREKESERERARERERERERERQDIFRESEYGRNRYFIIDCARTGA